MVKLQDVKVDDVVSSCYDCCVGSDVHLAVLYLFAVLSRSISFVLWLVVVLFLCVYFLVVMAALCNRGAIIFLPCSFFLSFFFLA